MGAETTQATGHCKVHGMYEAQYFRLGERWLGGYCPRCEAESAARKVAEHNEQSRQQRLEQRLRHAEIPPRFAGATLEAYDPPTERAAKIRGACQRYVERFPQHAETGAGLLLCGRVGTGKTHLACGIVRGVIEQHGVTARYTTVTKLVRSVRDTYAPGSTDTEGGVIRALVGLDLLVIDECGVQSGSTHEHNTLFEVMDERYAAMRPTILATNLPVDELAGVLGDRVIDRVREGGAVMTFDWSSYRGGKA